MIFSCTHNFISCDYSTSMEGVDPHSPVPVTQSSCLLAVLENINVTGNSLEPSPPFLSLTLLQVKFFLDQKSIINSIYSYYSANKKTVLLSLLWLLHS